MAQTPSPPQVAEPTRNVRAEVDDVTHKALRKRQNRMEDESGTRPQITEVVSIALSEWAVSQGQGE